MKTLKLSNLEVADICHELALLLHAGVDLIDGLYLLAEEERESSRNQLFLKLAKGMEEGKYLSTVMEEAVCFPEYAIGLLKVGEVVGRTEDTLQSISRYYEAREQMERQVRSALTYPAILLLLMLGVIVVLLSQVLPVFNEIFASLGGQLTGVAGGLLLIGQALDRAMPVLCVIFAVVLIGLAVFAIHAGFRGYVLRLWNKHFGDRGISKRLNNARFAQALSMGFASGLPVEDAIEQATVMMKDIPPAAKRCELCLERLQQGESLAHALGETGLMTPASCRLLTLGMRSGTGDRVIEEIARRMLSDAQEDLERMIAKIEPALVLVTSVLVGVILLSVMLPLMNIMSAIG